MAITMTSRMACDLPIVLIEPILSWHLSKYVEITIPSIPNTAKSYMQHFQQMWRTQI